MLIVHAADLHLDSPLLGLEAYDGCPRDALRRATRRALAALVDTAMAEHASLLLLAGDVFDGAWRDYSTGLCFVREMSRLREAGIPVVMLRGNHDAESQIARYLRMPDNVRELPTGSPSSIDFEGLGVSVHGQGYARRDVREDLTRNYPPPRGSMFNVGLLHTALEGRRGHETYAPTTVELLSELGYDYWALGHVHRHEVVSRAPFIVYPGNLQGRHIRETGKKGCVLLTVEAGKVTGLEHRALDVVRWADVEVVLGEDDTAASALDKAQHALAVALADAEARLVASRLTLTGATRAHAELATAGDHFVNDLRSVAIDLDRERLWLGDVRLATHLPFDLASLAGHGGPLSLLAGAVSAAKSDPDLGESLMSSLDELHEKLPEELRQDPAFACFHDREARLGLLSEVEELLVARLIGSAGQGTG